MYDLKEKTETAQKEVFDNIVEFFKRNRPHSFTASDIIKYLGILPGDNKWFAHAHLNILVEKGILEKSDHGKGFKYKSDDDSSLDNDSSIKVAI